MDEDYYQDRIDFIALLIAVAIMIGLVAFVIIMVS